MSYDDWKTQTAEDQDPRCEYCGAYVGRGSMAAKGWQPDRCDGQCRISWRDPDAEYEARRDS